MSIETGSALELDDIQAAALQPRPIPYAGFYLALRIDDRRQGRELLRRLTPSSTRSPRSTPSVRSRSRWHSASRA